MMNMKAMHKDFWMEIRKSKARFISIFMIVALGVAFFSGIQASSPDMRFSGDAYYDETNLMDIKVVGSLGLTEDDVAAIKQVDGVENAEGAYGTDVMCGEGEKQKVLHVEAVDQTMNRISVTEGKAPEKSGEIFLDCIFAESNGYKVGDQITLKEGGDSELLKKTDYTVVGLGESPLYISYNRGNSTLGSGEVNGFAYVLPEDFDQEVYTQIYVQAHGAQDLISYTDAYDSLIERVQEQVEGIEAEWCQVRYDEIVEEANEKLADARQELEDGKKEANEKLADARQELEDGKKKLKDGKKEYKDGKNITPDEIFAWSDAHKTTPKTSAPSLVDAIEILKPYVEEKREVICFSISSSMSTSGNVMRLAADELEASDFVTVIDSANLSTGIGLQVVEAAVMAQAGKSAAEITAALEVVRPKVRASFVVDTLMYLYRGGRCNAVAAMAGSVLKLHPKIVVENGAMDAAKKYRGKLHSVVMSYVRDMEADLKNARPERVFITHSGCDRKIVEDVQAYLQSLGIFQEILETRAGGVVSSHCGPGTLGVLFIAK